MANIPKNLREQAPAHQDATSEIDAFGHKERTQQANLGYLGKLFGSEKEKPGNISALILIVLVIILFLFIIGWLAVRGVRAVLGRICFKKYFLL